MNARKSTSRKPSRFALQALGEHHPDIGTSLDALGTVLAEQGDYQGAESYLTEALGVFEHSVGPEHVETAQALNNMGFVKIESGSYGEAAPFLERALAIFRLKWGKDHPQVATTSSSLATVRFRLGEVRAAAEAQREVLRIEKAFTATPIRTWQPSRGRASSAPGSAADQRSSGRRASADGKGQEPVAAVRSDLR